MHRLCTPLATTAAIAEPAEYHRRQPWGFHVICSASFNTPGAHAMGKCIPECAHILSPLPITTQHPPAH